MSDPDIEAACEDITKGLKTHRGCSPGSVYTDQPIFDAIAAATQIDTHPDGIPRIVMSASKFIEVFNNHRDRALCTSLGVAQRPLNTDAEPSRCKNTVARGESMETDALTGDAPVASVSTLSAQAASESVEVRCPHCESWFEPVITSSLPSTPRRTDLLGCRRCGGHGTILLGNRDRETCDLCHGTGADPDQSEAPSIPPADRATP